MSPLLQRLFLLGAVAGVASMSAPASGAQMAVRTAVSGLRPAVAGDEQPALAWTAHTFAGREQVLASIPADRPGVRVGPDDEGNDGAPSLVEIDRGRFLLVASRTATGRSRLWATTWDGGWGPASYLPVGSARNHHPAAAANGGAAWVVWVASEPGQVVERLLAARWQRGRWSAAEELPAAPGTPMAPRIAVDGRGRPLVVWSASDGHDAEIWYARRDRRGWLPAERLSDSDVPDIEPSVAFVDSRPIIAWSRFAPDGYRPVASSGNPRAIRFSRPRMLDSRPGSGSVVVELPQGAGIVWTSVAAVARSTELRMVSLAGRRQAPAVLGTVPNARVAAGGRLLAWAGRDAPGVGELTAAAGQPPRLATVIRSSPAPVVEAIAPSLPGTYRGFGDSITEGVIVTEGVIAATEGYPVPLGALISRLIDRPVLVANDGVAGETTPEGLERLAGLVFGNPALFTLIMEGTNDISSLIDADTVVTNLRAMVRRVRSVGGIAVVATLIPRVNEGDGGVRDEHTNLVNQGILTMVVEEGAMLVDQNAAFAGRPDLYSDRLHPTALGYEYMAGVWFRALQPILVHLLRQQETEDDRTRDDLLLDPRRYGIR